MKFAKMLFVITLVDQAVEHAFQLFQNDQRDKALQMMLKLLEQNPQNPKVVHGVAMLYLNMDKAAEAIPYLDLSLKLEPENPVFWCNYGAYLTRTNNHEKSLEYLFKAIELRGDYTDAMLNIGHVMSMLGRFDEAIEWATKAHNIVPGDEQLTMNLYTYLRDQDFPRGFEFLKKMKDKYDKPHYWRVVCSDSLYMDSIDENEVDAFHFELGRKVAGSIPVTKRYTTKADPNRKIRVGFLSSDLRRHSVSFFLMNWLKELDKDKFDLFFYHAMGAYDDVSERYEKIGKFHNIHASKVQTLVNNIYNDGIDILFDLNGLTIGGRPDVLAMKPAPILVSAIGYAHSVGLDRIDYRISDWHADPLGSEKHYAEKLYRLDDCFLCYGPFDPLPEIEEIPERDVIFGSFNNHLKLNPKTVKLWSDVLKAVPGSILLLKALGLRHPPIRDAVLSWFEKEGVRDRMRIMEPQENVKDHQEMYREIDIALDTVPYNGTTTTMESLMMGVPVVTLMGEVHRMRVTGSLLKSAGLEDLVAENDEQFIAIAKRLADDVANVRKGRAALRAKVEASPVMDAKAYAAKMATFMTEAWQQYCATVQK